MLLICTVVTCLSAAAQSWRSTLYPNDWEAPGEEQDFYEDAFLQDFSYAGYHRGADSIPFVTNNVLDVTAAPYNADASGSRDATAALQMAIDDAQAAGGGVVYLPAGTYTLSLPADSVAALRISRSNVVLRGAGAGQTFLYNTTTDLRQRQVILVQGYNTRAWEILPDVSERARLTRDLRGPATEIPVANARQFELGEDIIVRALMTNDWVREHREDPEWLDFEDRLDNVIHYRKVLAVSDTSLTIDSPIRYSLLTRDEAMVYSARPVNMIAEVGLEGFSIGNKEIVSADPNVWLDNDGTLFNNGHSQQGHPAYQLHASALIKIRLVRDSWVRNVSSYRHPDNLFGAHMLSNGIKFEFSSTLTVDDVAMGYPQYGGGGGNGYMYRIETNDCLYTNCRAEASRHGFSIVRIWSHGNVMHRTVDRLTGKATANSSGTVKTGSSGSDFHQWFSPSNLIDQMTVTESYFSAVHRLGVGSNPPHNAVTAHSAFWNFTANGAANGYAVRTSQTRTGYVIGTSGTTPGVNNRLDQPRNLLNPAVSGGPLAFRYDSDGSRTLPFDLVEGVGEGTRLEPQSLYLDQLRRRLNPSSSVSSGPESALVRVYPNPSATGHFSLSKSVSYCVFTLAGKQVTCGQGNSLDLSQAPEGTYLLQGDGWTQQLVR